MKYIYRILSIALFIGAITGSYAQSNDVLAKAAFLKAQELYGNAEYEPAIAKLDDVVKYLGSTNARVEFLRVQCYYELKNAEKAKQALASYFNVAGEDDPNYMTMLTRVEDINAMADLMSKSVRLEYKLIEGQTFEMTIRQMTDGTNSISQEITGRYTVLAVNANNYRMKYEIITLSPPSSTHATVGPAFAGKSIEFTLSKSGEISAINGVIALMGEVNSTLKGTKMKYMDRFTAEAFTAQYASNDVWKSILAAASPHTSEPVYPGKEWVKTEVVNTAQGNGKSELTYKLESITGSLAKISFKGTTTTTGTMDANGTVTGTLTMNTTTGIVTTGSQNTTVEMKVAKTYNPSSLARENVEAMMMAATQAPQVGTIKTTTTFRSN